MRTNRQTCWLAAVGTMVSVQGGASLAKHLFPIVGAVGATLLRVGLAAALMLLVFRPKVRTLSREQLKRCFLYGLSIIAMNQLFYCALARTPLGIAVTVEFVGPLALALLLSRKPLDFLWTALAVTGILLIGPWTQAHETRQSSPCGDLRGFFVRISLFRQSELPLSIPDVSFYT